MNSKSQKQHNNSTVRTMDSSQNLLLTERVWAKYKYENQAYYYKEESA